MSIQFTITFEGVKIEVQANSYIDHYAGLPHMEQVGSFSFRQAGSGKDRGSATRYYQDCDEIMLLASTEDQVALAELALEWLQENNNELWEVMNWNTSEVGQPEDFQKSQKQQESEEDSSMVDQSDESSAQVSNSKNNTPPDCDKNQNNQNGKGFLKKEQCSYHQMVAKIHDQPFCQFLKSSNNIYIITSNVYSKPFKQVKIHQNRAPNNIEFHLKVNVNKVFNKGEEMRKPQQSKDSQSIISKKQSLFQQLYNNNSLDIQRLKELAWNGIPSNHRPHSWKLLLKYMSNHPEGQRQAIQRKRKAYLAMANAYCLNADSDTDKEQIKMMIFIKTDSLRTLPQSQLFRNIKIQTILRRVLYVWHVRHPAIGYTSSMNQIIAPFLIVLLMEYVDVNLDTLDSPSQLQQMQPRELQNLQGDLYFCFSKFLQGILDNYRSWTGIKKAFTRIQEVIKRVDPQLLAHLEANNVDCYQMFFAWAAFLLIKQLPMGTSIRLIDTYLSLQDDFFSFCSYIISAIILKFSTKLKDMAFQQVMNFQQSMPLKGWGLSQIETVIAEAYVFQSCFAK